MRAASAGVQPTDLLYVLYTSGSTARPKGVTLAHAACLENGFHIGERQHLTGADRLWLAVPLCWSFAAANALMALLTHGGTVVLQERFDAEEAVRLIAAERCTVYYGMSHMAQAMLETPAWGHYDTRSLRTGLTIGTPEEIALTMHRLGVHQICNVYGATETYGNATVTDASEPEAVRLQSQGTPLPGMRLRIVHPDTRAVLPPGEVGEILVAGRVTPGYYRDPEPNARAFDAEGSFLTGDLGMLDAAGRLHFRGRLKDLIKAGGINISPLEVEAYLMTHPKVHYAAVVGLPDAVKGEVPVAAVELRAGEAATAEEIRGFCRGHIASYKVPVQVVFLRPDEFPRTNTGKVEKMALRQVMAARLGHPLYQEPVGWRRCDRPMRAGCDRARRDRPGLRTRIRGGCHDHPRAGTESPRRAGDHRPSTPPQCDDASDDGGVGPPVGHVRARQLPLYHPDRGG